MSTVLYDWPYAGLVLAAALFARLCSRPPTNGLSRWADPVFVLRLLWPMYLVHQFEEHGIDALGRHFAFVAGLCKTLGHDEVAGCPADPAFIFSVNVLACTVAFVMPVAWARRRPLLAAFGWSVPLVNAATHIGAAVLHRAYNPGLVTSIVLFVPLGVWMLRLLVRSRVLAVGQIPLIFLAGGLLHAILIGSLIAVERGAIDRAELLVINAVNGLVPLTIGLLVNARARVARTARAASA